MSTVINALFILLATLFSLGSHSAFAQSVSFPDKPRSHSFVVDQAQMLSGADLAEIDHIAQVILIEERTPIYIVTIDALSDFGANSMSIELYSQKLFDEWGIGYKHRNYGMLLLISKSDRRMRIELGKDWAGTRNQDAQYLVDKVMIPRFKDGDYSQAILEGVRGMDAIARGLDLPSPYYQWWVLPSLSAFSFFAFLISLSLFKSGRKGSGWAVLILAIGVLMFILKVIYDTIASGSSGDGFGGGFSGGGGASGSW